MNGIPAADEEARLEALYSYNILDTAPETAFDDITRLAALACATPAALLVFNDRARTWIKSSVGLDGVQLSNDFGSYFIPKRNRTLIIIQDALLEPGLAAPATTGGSQSPVRFYASAPVLTDEGRVLGILCVADPASRTLTKEQQEGLLALARQAMNQLELRRHFASQARPGYTHAVERRVVEEAAVETEKLYRELVEFNLGYIVTHDLECVILSVNPAMCEALGYTPAEMIGRKLSEFVTPACVSLLENYLARVKNRQISDGIIRLLTKDGAELVWVYRGVCHDIDEDCPYILWFAQDVAEFEHADDATRLSESQNQRSQTLAAIQKLAGGVAHNLNNLITVISLHSHMMLKHMLPEEPMYRHLANAHQAADRAALLIRQLLAFSRKQVLQPRIIKLNEVVAETESQLRQVAGDDLQLVIRLGQAGFIKADPRQVEQVVRDLVAHAREALPAGGTLVIETVNTELENYEHTLALSLPAGRYVSLSVAYAGSTIDDDAKAHIFEPFHTTKNALDGLRLPAVYGIVKQSGGDIIVSSGEGKETSFKVYLPRVDDSELKKKS